MKVYKFILVFLIIVLGACNVCAQHLFSISYNDLSQENVRQVKEQVANSAVSITSLARGKEGKYDISFSTVQNTKIIILNEETGNSVIITPVEGALTQFELFPFFIEELRQATLGNANLYLVLETDTNFLVRNAAFIFAASQEVFIPNYFYGPKEDVKEALPKDRQIINIFKEKPRLIPAFPDDPENLRYIANLEEEMSYYVYMYKLPDGTLCIYDEHFNPSAEENVANAITPNTCCGNLQFDLSGSMSTLQQTATKYALELWSGQLVGTVPVDINVTFTYMDPPALGASYRQPNFLDNGTYNPQYPNTWYSSAQWNQMVGYDATTQRDIRIEMNSYYSSNFYYGLDGNAGNLTDYVTIMLHEVTHGLGFYPLCGSNGAYSYGSFPGIFDRQLYQGSIGNTCLTDLTQSQRAALVISGNLYAGCPSSYLLTANGGNRVKMYAPNPWKQGSSVSHWDQSVNNFPTFMKYIYISPLHTFNSRKIAIMRDMGWKIICPPSSIVVNFTNQIVTTNTTVTSAGDINIQNIKVKNGAKLILDAACNVNIISDFEVDLGSEFEIK